MKRTLVALALLAFTLVAVSPASADDAPKKKKAEPTTPTAEALFKKLDADSNDKLSLDEFKKLESSIAVAKGKKAKNKPTEKVDLEQVFKQLDKNGDSSLSAEEFKTVTTLVTLAPTTAKKKKP